VIALLREFKHGLRILRTRPAFSFVVVLTLALGIGANSAVFSVVNAVLLKPLPYHDPDRLVVPWGRAPQLGFDRVALSYPNYLDWKSQSNVFSDFGIYVPFTVNLTGRDEPEQIPVTLVSANLFPMLGVTPVRGRGILPAEARLGGEHVALVSYGCWQRRFGSAPNLLGSKITLDGQSYEVVGIMPQGFQFPPSFNGAGTQLKSTDLWLPLALDPQKELRGRHHLFPLARLKPGASVARAQDELATIARRLEQQYPDTNNRFGALVVPLSEQAANGMKRMLLLLLGSVSLVLLLACANVANLTLTRALARDREFTIRSAMGAGRSRLLPLSLLGGLFGLALAQLGIKLLIAFSPGNIPRLDETVIDSRVLIFTFIISLLTVVLFGLVPAMHASRSDLASGLRDGLRSTGGTGTGRIRRALGAAEVALALILLIGAGLMIKSLFRLTKVDPGFRPEGVLTLGLTLPQAKYPGAVEILGFYDRVTERLRSLPGVQSIGAVSMLPLGGLDVSTGFFIEGKPDQPGESRQLHFRSSMPGYFQTMGIGLRQGRDFAPSDGPKAHKVIIVNETMARQFWPGESPLGRHMAIDFEVDSNKGDMAASWREVVGVIADVKHMGLGVASDPEAFTPFAQARWRGTNYVLRSQSDPRLLLDPIRRAVHEVDRDLPIANISTMDNMVAQSIAQPRFNVLLFSLFAVLAVVLAAVGIYAVISSLVAQQRHEIGIRIALGADQGMVAGVVARQAAFLVAIGLAIGLLTALALSSVLRNLLFEVNTTDTMIFSAAPILVILAALLACAIPTYRAIRVDPMTALRGE